MTQGHNFQEEIVKQVKERKRRAITAGSLMTAVGATAAVLLAPAQPASAQQSTIDTLRTQIEELTQRLNTLEAEQKKTADAATKTAAAAVSARERLQISGLLQVHGLGYLSQDDGPGPEAPDTFRL